MLTDEKGSQLQPFEKALLENYDGKIASVLINGDRNGHCDLTEAFVYALFNKVWNTEDGYTIVSRIINCNDFLTPTIVDAIFDTKDVALIRQYVRSSRGFGMESRHVIALLELNDSEAIDFYFSRHAVIVLTDNWYRPVVEWLKETGFYSLYREKYMPQRFGRN